MRAAREIWNLSLGSERVNTFNMILVNSFWDAPISFGQQFRPDRHAYPVARLEGEMNPERVWVVSRHEAQRFSLFADQAVPFAVRGTTGLMAMRLQRTEIVGK